MIIRPPTSEEIYKRGQWVATAYSFNMIWDILEYSPNCFAIVIATGTEKLYRYFLRSIQTSQSLTISVCMGAKHIIVEGLSLKQIMNAVQQLTIGHYVRP